MEVFHALQLLQLANGDVVVARITQFSIHVEELVQVPVVGKLLIELTHL